MAGLEISLWFLAVQGSIGAFDTLYYHEWRARLPALQTAAKKELVLHAGRDLVYAILFLSLPLFAWRGWFAFVLALLLTIEIVLTSYDFIVEDWVRKPLGGVYPGERVTHGIMGIVYGLMLANLAPIVYGWWSGSSGFVSLGLQYSPWLKGALLMMGGGVLVSGVRDFAAAYALPYSAWPWSKQCRTE